jgi:hypothetical protein
MYLLVWVVSLVNGLRDDASGAWGEALVLARLACAPDRAGVALSS